MKNARRILSILLALALGLAVVVPAFAADDPAPLPESLFDILRSEWQDFKDAIANLLDFENFTFPGFFGSLLLVSGLAIFFIGAGIACIPVVLFYTGPKLLIGWIFG